MPLYGFQTEFSFSVNQWKNGSKWMSCWKVRNFEVVTVVWGYDKFQVNFWILYTLKHIKLIFCVNCGNSNSYSTFTIKKLSKIHKKTTQLPKTIEMANNPITVRYSTKLLKNGPLVWYVCNLVVCNWSILLRYCCNFYFYNNQLSSLCLTKLYTRN